MNFRKHYDLEGKHAFLGASKYHWIRYDPEKVATSYNNYLATLKGTELHEFAHNCIRLHRRQPRNKDTLNQFVNDAIGFRMESEQVLYYSENCFGTADAISFRDNKLKIFDLKTGETPAHFEQLMVYAALFCLEYGFKPDQIDILLRIYQFNDYTDYEPSPQEIEDVMNKIKEFDSIINEVRKENDWL